MELTPSEFGGLDQDALGRLPATDLQRIHPRQMGALPETMRRFVKERISVNAITNPSQIPLIDPEYVGAVPVSIIARMTPDQVWQTPGDTLAAFRRAQLHALSDREQIRELKLSCLKPEQIAALLPAQLAAVEPRVLASLFRHQIRSLTPGQLKALHWRQVCTLPPVFFEALKPESIAELGFAQLRSIPSGTIAQLSGRPISNLTPAQFGKLGLNQIAGLGREHIQVITREQLSAMDHEQLIGLAPHQIQAFSSAQLQTFGKKLVESLYPDQLKELSQRQIVHLKADVVPIFMARRKPLAEWPVAELMKIPPSVFGEIINISLLPSAVICRIDRPHLQAIPAEKMAGFSRKTIQSLSEKQIGGLAPTQIRMFTAEQIGYLGIEQVQALSPAQLSSLGSLQGFTLEHIRVLSREQLNTLRVRELGDAQLNALQPHQISYLTPLQMAELFPQQVAILLPEQLGALAVEQLVGWEGIHVQVLGNAQIAGLRPDVRQRIAELQLAEGIHNQEDDASHRMRMESDLRTAASLSNSLFYFLRKSTEGDDFKNNHVYIHSKAHQDLIEFWENLEQEQASAGRERANKKKGKERAVDPEQPAENVILPAPAAPGPDDADYSDEDHSDGTVTPGTFQPLDNFEQEGFGGKDDIAYTMAELDRVMAQDFGIVGNAEVVPEEGPVFAGDMMAPAPAPDADPANDLPQPAAAPNAAVPQAEITETPEPDAAGAEPEPLSPEDQEKRGLRVFSGLVFRLHETEDYKAEPDRIENEIFQVVDLMRSNEAFRQIIGTQLALNGIDFLGNCGTALADGRRFIMTLYRNYLDELEDLPLSNRMSWRLESCRLDTIEKFSSFKIESLIDRRNTVHVREVLEVRMNDPFPMSGATQRNLYGAEILERDVELLRKVMQNLQIETENLDAVRNDMKPMIDAAEARRLVRAQANWDEPELPLPDGHWQYSDQARNSWVSESEALLKNASLVFHLKKSHPELNIVHEEVALNNRQYHLLNSGQPDDLPDNPTELQQRAYDQAMATWTEKATAIHIERQALTAKSEQLLRERVIAYRLAHDSIAKLTTIRSDGLSGLRADSNYLYHDFKADEYYQLIGEGNNGALCLYCRGKSGKDGKRQDGGHSFTILSATALKDAVRAKLARAKAGESVKIGKDDVTGRH